MVSVTFLNVCRQSDVGATPTASLFFPIRMFPLHHSFPMVTSKSVLEFLSCHGISLLNSSDCLARMIIRQSSEEIFT